MGITGLIPFLKEIWQPTNVDVFSGGVAAIDAYPWLHKGVYSCADRIARNEDCNTIYVSYCLRYVDMLISKNVTPIMVFDGFQLPMKMGTEEKRKKLRDESRHLVEKLMKENRTNDARRSHFCQSIEVTHEMAANLIQACRLRNIQCIVAPFEADAQLAYLSIEDLADVIITEDSDLLLFGAKKVLFKMDTNGNGLLIERSTLHIPMGLSHQQFKLEKFRHMCILSGCDYLPSLLGIGLKKAHRFIIKSGDEDICMALRKLSKYLSMPRLSVTEEYCDKFLLADFWFKFQPVFDPRVRCIRPLLELTSKDGIARYEHLIESTRLTDEEFVNFVQGNVTLVKERPSNNSVHLKGSTCKNQSREILREITFTNTSRNT